MQALPVVAEPARRHGKGRGGKILRAHPGEHQEARVDHQQVSVAAAAPGRSIRSSGPGRGASSSPPRTAGIPACVPPGRRRNCGCAARTTVGSRDSGGGPRRRSTVAVPRCRRQARGTADGDRKARRRVPVAGRRRRSRPARTSCPGPWATASAAASGCRAPPASPAASCTPRPGSRPSLTPSGDVRRWSSPTRCGCDWETAPRSSGCPQSAAGSGDGRKR